MLAVWVVRGIGLLSQGPPRVGSQPGSDLMLVAVRKLLMSNKVQE